MRPGALSPGRVAGMLHVPVGFVDTLCARHALPRPHGDGSLDGPLVAEALRRNPWLRRLDVPYSETELAAVSPRLRIPEGLGFEQAGRRYAVLWRVLDAAWGGTHGTGHDT